MSRVLSYENPAESLAIQGYVDEDKDRSQQLPVFSRAVILDVINDPYALTSDKLEYYKAAFGLPPNRARLGAVLPRNTVLARRILDVSGTGAEPPIFLFPFFPPHISLPSNPGEHVWALIHHESPLTIPEHGYWICRIVEYNFVDDLNHTHPPRAIDTSFFPKKGETPNYQYSFVNGRYTTDQNGEKIYAEGTQYIMPKKGDGFEDAYVDLINQGLNQTSAARLVKYDAVPRYFKRPGDIVFEGSNNSLIVMGTERSGTGYESEDQILTKNSSDPDQNGEPEELTVPSPVFPEADKIGTKDSPGPHGMIDIVVGRGQLSETKGPVAKNDLGSLELDKAPASIIQFEREGDPDLLNDRSRIRLSESTKVDEFLGGGIVDFNKAQFSIVDTQDGDGAIVIKTDKLRLIARQDVEILVTSPVFDADNNAIVDSEDQTKWAAVVIKSNGDIVFRPSDTGYIKLGDDTADKAILCTASPYIQASLGQATHAPIFNTMGGQVGKGMDGGNDFGTFATKVLVK